ncbi:MAG: ATP-binding protein [Flavobacteriales bacterium]|nr:ATP-binding protein [Flavobacteriales bacterium]
MIIGLFQRHFKTYKGAKYIPFGIKEYENFNLFIGQNGAGKSSILECLNCYFNHTEFIYHTNEKRSEAFIAPLFLIKKYELSRYDKKSQALIPIISNFFINTLDISSHSNYSQYSSFMDQQAYLKRISESHYVFTIAFWPQTDNSSQHFFTFDNLLKKKILEYPEIGIKEYESSINKLKADIQKNYKFLYIPVETSIEDFLRLESKGMQDLMSEDVKKRIERVLNEKHPIKGEKVVNKSILDIVNNDLETFIKDVEKTIQKIDSEYDFEKEYKAKTKLTANHLSDVMIETYFSKRKLKKSGKQIKYLSAGERKKALIDIAYSFLTQEENRITKIILGIDEPESSLHISMCYDQFERLQELSNNFDVQTMITSHWYGSLPIIEQGNLYHIEDKKDIINIEQFSFRNYFEDVKGTSSDIHFKSFFDLSSAIISSLRVKKNNWLIVESEEDKKYILKHIENIENLKVLPVGGCAIVKLLYNYLYTPISHNAEKSELNGKIFCLIDTDFQGVGSVNFLEDLKNGMLKMRRLQVMENQEIQLHKISTDIKFPTEIEESLDPKAFYSALETVIKSSGNEKIITVFQKFKFDDKAVNSYIKGDNSIIYPDTTKEIEGNPKHLKDTIAKFIEDNKKKICDEYCKIEEIEKPKWINEIEIFFNK